jgi:hypothetical protein
MTHTPTLPSYPLYLLLHPAHVASLRAQPASRHQLPLAAKATTVSSGNRSRHYVPTFPSKLDHGRVAS